VPELAEVKESLKVDQARDLIGVAIQQFGDVARDALQQITRDIIAQALEAAATIAVQAADAVKSSAPDIAEAAKSGTERAGAVLSAAAHQVADAAEDVRKHDLAEALSVAAKGVKGAAEELQGGAQDAVETLQEGAQDAIEQLQDQLPGAKKKKKRGGFFRFLLLGLLVGAAIAFFSRRGGDDDDDFGEENWIEVKHDESGPVASAPPSAATSTEFTAAPEAAAEPAEPKDMTSSEE
jgi:hypothetical protein